MVVVVVVVVVVVFVFGVGVGVVVLVVLVVVVVVVVQKFWAEHNTFCSGGKSITGVVFKFQVSSFNLLPGW